MRRKLLVVDDEPQIRRFVRRVAERLGHEVREAKDGDEAMDMARRERPDLVLLDIHMPRVDGMLVLRELLALDPSLAVVMLTGDGSEERGRWLLEAGARDYISKPVDLDYLTMALTAHLAVAR